LFGSGQLHVDLPSIILQPAVSWPYAATGNLFSSGFEPHVVFFGLNLDDHVSQL
jgi:hypothetical protein